jgi:hypothetical protein
MESLRACRHLALGLLDWKPCDSRFGLPSELTKATVHGCQMGAVILTEGSKDLGVSARMQRGSGSCGAAKSGYGLLRPDYGASRFGDMSHDQNYQGTARAG